MSEREAYPSVEAMVEPSVLGGLLGRPVTSVVLEPMQTKGWSSTEAVFEAVLVDDERSPAAVVKRMRWSADWHAIATDDTLGREVAIWESGVLDRLPPEIGHGVLAAARFDDGAALLMDDLSDHFVPDDTHLTLDRVTGVLRSMAALHAAFWQDPPRRELGDAMARLDRRISALSPTSLAALADVLPDNGLVVDFPSGWDRLPTLIDPGVARAVQALADDPTPVVAALDPFPVTLTHGDWRPANIAWDGCRAIPVDWQPTVAPPGFECVYYVAGMGGFIPLHPDRAIALYRDLLQQAMSVPDASWSWWDDHLDICIAAEFVMMACVYARFEQYDPQRDPPWETIRWSVERARRGLRLIDQA